MNVALLLPVLLAAAPPAVHLDYVRGLGGEGCPDEEATRAAVRARLGFEPFREPATLTVRAQVGREGELLKGRILLEEPGRPVRTRELSSRQLDCAELAPAMQLAISIAIDPLSAVRPAPVPEPSPEPEPALPPPPPPEVQPAASPPALWELGVGGVVSLGLAPGVVTGGASVGAGLRWPSFSLALEARADWPRALEIAEGKVAASCLYGQLAPCWRLGPFGACGLVAAGVLRGEGQQIVESRSVTTPFVAAGARALAEWPAEGPIAGRVSGEVLVPFTRTSLRVGDVVAWTTPPAAGTLGIWLVGRIP